MSLETPGRRRREPLRRPDRGHQDRPPGHGDGRAPPLRRARSGAPAAQPAHAPRGLAPLRARRRAGADARGGRRPTSASPASACASSRRAPCASCGWSRRRSSSTCAASSLGGVEPLFVDCHSHVCRPATTARKRRRTALELCDLAAALGHRDPVRDAARLAAPAADRARERDVRGAYEQLKARARLELRLGFELTPAPPLLREDPARYVARRAPTSSWSRCRSRGPPPMLVELAEHIERAGLRPVIAHPERTEPVRERPELAHELAAALAAAGERHEPARPARRGDRGARLAAASRPATRRSSASDGHRWSGPRSLDEAYELVSERYGDGAARLFDGSALGCALGRDQEPRRRCRAVSAW